MDIGLAHWSGSQSQIFVRFVRFYFRPHSGSGVGCRSLSDLVDSRHLYEGLVPVSFGLLPRASLRDYGTRLGAQVVVASRGLQVLFTPPSLLDVRHSWFLWQLQALKLWCDSGLPLTQALWFLHTHWYDNGLHGLFNYTSSHQHLVTLHVL